MYYRYSSVLLQVWCITLPRRQTQRSLWRRCWWSLSGRGRPARPAPTCLGSDLGQEDTAQHLNLSEHGSHPGLANRLLENELERLFSLCVNYRDVSEKSSVEQEECFGLMPADTLAALCSVHGQRLTATVKHTGLERMLWLWLARGELPLGTLNESSVKQTSSTYTLP